MIAAAILTTGIIATVAQMGWQEWREIINWSTPLAGLIIVSYGIYRGVKWVAIKFIEPFAGADGLFANYLRTQEQESKKQTSAMHDLVVKFETYASETKAGIETLVEMHSDPGSIFSTTETERRLGDLLRIQSLLAESVKHIAHESERESAVALCLKQIKEVVDQYK